MICNITVVLLLLALCSVSIVDSADNCCRQNTPVRTYRTCADGEAILPKCDGLKNLLNNEWNFYSSYIIRNDSKGEYLDDYVGNYIVRSPK